jgi:hypothetical protein
MNSPSEDIKDMLVTAGLGTFGTNLFIGLEPTTPDICTTIYDTGGEPAEVDYNYERPTVMVRVRGAEGGYRAAHLVAQSIRDELNGKHNVTVNSARYVGIWMQTDVLAIGTDDNGRPLFTINFRIHRTG